MDAAIQAADERMIFLEYDEEARRTYLMRQKALRDHINSEQFAIEKRMKKVARKMKKAGKPINEIVEFTELSHEEVEKL